MTFISLQWLGWIAGATLLYWSVPMRHRRWILVGISALFLFAMDWVSGLALLALTVLSYRLSGLRKFKMAGTVAAIAIVVAILGFYKVRLSTAPLDVIRSVAMPLGLSYYSFRIVHYLIERARGTIEEHGFADYLGYLFFLPTIVVGPIHRFEGKSGETGARSPQVEMMAEGMERILVGYFKVTVLGNYLIATVAAREIGTLTELHRRLVLYLEAARGSLNLYLQFAGYSDIAIGFALLLGYRVMENFDRPFLKSNISEFWRSWHMSLTTWSRDYIYMPVVGATRQPVYGTMASLLLIGVWHELSLRYVLWGLYHGVGIITVNQTRKFLRKKKLAPVKAPLARKLLYAMGVVLTFNYFVLGYVIISQERVADMLRVYAVLFFGT